MTLLVTIIAAIASTLIWVFNSKRTEYKLSILPLMYWGASLMWFCDFAFEYAEMRAEYFTQPIADVFNDFLLGITVAVLGVLVWLVVFLIKDPTGVVKKAILRK